MTRIHPIAPEWVNLMAAGEVIDSVASVVRELIDNALDAGSTRIQIDLWPQQWRIRVSDNGCGLPHSDLVQAALPHSSSKFTDPFAVTTLGFRGEALHSLAQLGKLTIQTWHASDPHGWLAHYGEDGSGRDLQPTACGLGTVVTVSDLFSEWPSRRLALESLKPVITVVESAALAHPQVTWILNRESESLVTIASGQTLSDILLQRIPRLQRADLRAEQTAGMELVLGLPDRAHRPRPDWIRVFVNRRLVSLPPLIQTIQTAFSQTLPRHRHPICVVRIEVPPEQVDWHRHPAKTELYLQPLESCRTTLAELIANTLQPSNRQSSQRAVKLLRLGEAASPYQVRDLNPLPASQPLLPLKALAQLQNTYILAEHDTGLWLVEQHVAHERVRYEHLLQQWQWIELPDPLLLDQLTPLQLENLQALGMDPDPFGSDVWAIRRIPAALWSAEQPKTESIAAVLELSHCTHLQAAQVATACRSAIRNNTPLTLSQMQTLLDCWQATANPHTCPHGRPIYLTLAEKDLARFFRRNWMLCDRPGSVGGRGLGDRLAADILPFSQDEG